MGHQGLAELGSRTLKAFAVNDQVNPFVVETIQPDHVAGFGQCCGVGPYGVLVLTEVEVVGEPFVGARAGGL